MSSVTKFKGPPIDPTAHRVVEGMSLEDFCLADAGRGYSRRHNVSGMTILSYPDVIMICTASGECSAIRYRWATIEDHLHGALAALSA